MKVEIILLDGAEMPTRAEGRPVGFDLSSFESVRVSGNGGIKKVRTGIKMAIEEGYYGKVSERSGVSTNTPLSIKGGYVDSDYRGEVHIIVMNSSSYPYDIQKGDKIAQLIIKKQEDVELEKVDAFTEPETLRGENGFGSSDKA